MYIPFYGSLPKFYNKKRLYCLIKVYASLKNWVKNAKKCSPLDLRQVLGGENMFKYKYSFYILTILYNHETMALRKNKGDYYGRYYSSN